MCEGLKKKSSNSLLHTVVSTGRLDTLPAISMNTFAVVAHTKKRIFADDCEEKTNQKYSKGHFLCIDCKSDVFIRRGSQRIWHFSHHTDQETKQCPHANGGETREHYDAKHFIAKNISRCAFTVEKCPTCSRQKNFVGRSIHVHKCAAEVEKRIQGTKRVADVAVIHPANGKCVAAIEILHTHATDADKRRDCAMQGIPILEVSTDQVQQVQQSSSSSDKYSLMQFQTTGMKWVDCTHCAMSKFVLGEMKTTASYEMWYNSMWSKSNDMVCAHTYITDSGFISNKLNGCQICTARRKETKLIGRAGSDLSDVLSYEEWYTYMWDKNDKKQAADRKYKILSDERQLHIKNGRKAAHAKTYHACLNNRIHRGSMCFGKCTSCQKWVFGDDPDNCCEVTSDTMTQDSWNELFETTPIKYRKKYKKADGEFNLIYVHEECSMPCPSCENTCLVALLVKYGMCFQCNNFYKSALYRIQHPELAKLTCELP